MRSRRTFLVLAVASAAAAALFAVGSCQKHGGAGVLDASGTVEATDAQLGFQVTGRIDAISAREGDVVHSGDAVAYLDTTETAARRDQAIAAARAAAAQLAELERGSRSEEIAQARAGRDAAETRLADAQRDLDRTQRLNQDGAVSREALDKAQLSLDVAKSQFTQADEQFRLIQQGPRAERIAAARAQLAQANAAVAQVTATLANMTLRSPFDGVVTVRSREPGETVPAGASVLTVMNRDDRWVRIYVPETRIGAVRLGGPATITTDTYRGKSYPGTIAYIASEAEFTPKTVQTKEERVKLVYAVKVRIDMDKSYDLKPGMPADVRLEPAKP
jgi:HlyD family secretion protein